MSGLLGAAAVTATAVVAATIAWRLVRPPPRLAPRVRPYATAAAARLGAPVASFATRRLLPRADHLPERIVAAAAGRLGGLVEGTGDEAVAARLRHADLLQEVPEDRRVTEYRLRVLRATATSTLGLSVPLALVGAAAPLVLLAGLLGGVHGATRWRARVDRAIEDRRLRMRIELYTVNQLLAMHVRVGGGVVQALQGIVTRGSGAIVAELGEVLRAHRSGRPVTEALHAAAATSAEPNAARTYRLLANGVELGVDLAGALRALSEDIRDQRVEAMKRAATRRRAAMLVPIIALLAPIMLLFIAAPLPSLVLGFR